MSRSLFSKYAVWAILTLPALYVIYQYMTGHFTYGQALSLSGDIAVKLLIVVMAVTPVRLAFPRAAISAWLLKSRRAIGVAVFAYGGFHLWIYLDKKTDLSRIISEGLGIDILTGWIAFFIFVPLAITSHNRWVRKLGRKWKQLHRWIYPAAVLVLLHWILTAYDPTSAYIHAGILLALEAYRLFKQRRI